MRPKAEEHSRQKVSLKNKTVIKQQKKSKLVSFIILLRNLSFAHSFGNFNNSLMREGIVCEQEGSNIKERTVGKDR